MPRVVSSLVGMKVYKIFDFPCFKNFKSVTYFRLKWRTIGRSGGNVEKFKSPVPRQWKVMQRRRNIHMERGMSVD